MKYSKLTEEILKKAGWYEGRNIDISEYVYCYKKIGVKANNKIERFLSEFGGLQLIYPVYRVDNKTEDLKISYKCSSLSNYKKDTQEYYEERSGEYLVLIGDMCDMYLYVYMSLSGGIYATDGDYMTKYQIE